LKSTIDTTLRFSDTHSLNNPHEGGQQSSANMIVNCSLL
jgi:hypothetical protein